jgi:hypothetical protein
VYVATSELGALLTNTALQAEAIAFVARNPSAPPSLDTLFSLYSAFVPQNPWLTVGALWDRRHRDFRRVDVRRLVQFGLARRLLRRVHKYLVFDPAVCAAADSDLV